jgi:Lon-like ATP-dependent protease
MEIIRLSGYILDEKMAIAEQYLAPTARTACGLTEDQVVLEQDAMKSLITGYCREAGVRNLGQHIEKILRKVALKVVRGDAATPEVVTADTLSDLVGKPVFSSDKMYERTPPGVVMGLAWTSMGGMTLYVESSNTYGGPRWVEGGKEELSVGRM